MRVCVVGLILTIVNLAKLCARAQRDLLFGSVSGETRPDNTLIRAASVHKMRSMKRMKSANSTILRQTDDLNKVAKLERENAGLLEEIEELKENARKLERQIRESKKREKISERRRSMMMSPSLGMFTNIVDKAARVTSAGVLKGYSDKPFEVIIALQGRS